MKKISIIMFVAMLLTVFQAKAFYVDGLEYRDDGEYVTLIGAADKTINHLTIPASISYNSKTYSVGKNRWTMGRVQKFFKVNDRIHKPIGK